MINTGIDIIMRQVYDWRTLIVKVNYRKITPEESEIIKDIDKIGRESGNYKAINGVQR
jgi:hypothetical protein